MSRSNPNQDPLITPRWMKVCLILAGAYNIIWGCFVIFWPHALFDWTQTERLNYPEIWQCVGMVVGVYGIGYFLAARDPATHWPIVLVGFLGKILGPIGFLAAWYQGRLPGAWAAILLTNDLIWWIPFAAILGHATRVGLAVAPRRQFVWESRIAATPAEVFRFHEDPGALSRLIPPWERVRVRTPPASLQVGTKVVLENQVGPFRLRWIATHEEYDPPHRFADRQQAGPFAYWYHRHLFLDDGTGGTILRDDVEYTIPGGWLGELLLGRWVEAKLTRLFEFRHERTRELIESGTHNGVSVSTRATG